MMAGDKQFTHSGGIIFTGKTKIHEIPAEVAREMFGVKRAFVGFCGNADSFADMDSEKVAACITMLKGKIKA